MKTCEKNCHVHIIENENKRKGTEGKKKMERNRSAHEPDATQLGERSSSLDLTTEAKHETLFVCICMRL